MVVAAKGHILNLRVRSLVKHGEALLADIDLGRHGGLKGIRPVAGAASCVSWKGQDGVIRRGSAEGTIDFSRGYFEYEVCDEAWQRERCRPFGRVGESGKGFAAAELKIQRLRAAVLPTPIYWLGSPNKDGEVAKGPSTAQENSLNRARQGTRHQWVGNDPSALLAIQNEAPGSACDLFMPIRPAPC